MKKILFLSTCVRGGGAGWSLFSLVKNLDRARFDPRVVVPASGIFGDLYRSLNVPLVEIPALPERMASARSALSDLLRLGRSAREIAALALRTHIDLLYCNNMLTKPVGWLAGGVAKRPVIFHCRNIHDTWARSFFYPLLARSPRVRKVICNSEASRKPYARWVDSKALVIHNGVDLDRFTNGVPGGSLRKDFGMDAATPAIGYFGNLIPRKGPDVLIEAVPHVLVRAPRTRFFLVGDKPIGSDDRFKQALVQRVKDLGIDRSVAFVGAVPDIRPHMKEMSVAAVPSVQEPFGRVVIEAMAMGVPVIGTAVGGIPEIIRSGENGMLIPPSDPRALAEAIVKLIEDPGLADRLARVGVECVREHFSAAAVTRRIESVLEAV